MSEVKPMTAAEQNLRACQKQLDMDGVMVGVSRQALEETLAELDASRAREAKLVEALREALGLIREAHEPPSRDMSLSAEWDVIVALRLPRLDALLPTPAEMPADVHPQEG